MKRLGIILAAVIVAAGIAAGSFYAGMAYQRNQVNQIRAQFLQRRGGPAGNETAGGGGLVRGFFGGGVTGQVKSIAGNVLTLSTAQNVTTVNLSDSTRIEKSALGAASDLQPGQRVIVTGQRDTSGNITAAQVLILDMPAQSANNSQAGGGAAP